MKKKLIISLLIIVTLFSAGCTALSQTPTKETQNKKAWTVLVYMNGSNLEMTSSAATNDLREMLYSGSGNDVNVVVQTGGSQYWHNYYVDADRSQRWYVKKFRMDEVDSQELQNMAKADTLSDFLIWGVENYPAQKYAVVLWNHGGGAIAGFGLDENAQGDTLILKELKDAFASAQKETKETFSLVAFDACLMSNIETAYILSPYCDYMAASEGLLSEKGYAYDVFIDKIKENPAEDGAYYGKVLIDSYIEQANKTNTVESSLSVLDLSYVGDVVSEFNKSISSVDVINYFDDFANAAYNSSAAGRLVSSAEQANMVDIQDFVENISNTNLSSQLNNLVVYKVQTANSQEDLSGVSLYFPYSNIQNVPLEFNIYSTIGFSKVYTQLLKNYIDLLDENIADTSYDMVNTKNIVSNIKSLVDTSCLLSCEIEGKTVVYYVCEYSANDQNTKNAHPFLYMADETPITVYQKEKSENLLYTTAIINGQYCELTIQENNTSLSIKEAIAIERNKNKSIVPLKTFTPKANDSVSFVTLVYEDNKFVEKISKEMTISEDSQITKVQIEKNKTKMFLKGLEIK